MVLDPVDLKLVQMLQQHARTSFAALGRRVGLSPPAVAERVRKLEEAGVIKGYHAEVDQRALGLPITAFIRLNTPADRYEGVIRLAQQAPEVLECHHVAGGDAFVIKVVAPSVEELEALIGRFSPYGTTTTSIVLSSPVVKRIEIGNREKVRHETRRHETRSEA